jgi:hypothetical protein
MIWKKNRFCDIDYGLKNGLKKVYGLKNVA